MTEGFRMDIRRLDERAAVSPQIVPEDVAAIKAAGYVKIVNNRPDGEEADQPAAATIEAAAREAGLSYENVPLGREGITYDHIGGVRAALAAADGPVLLFCRSGTRSATLWALAEAANGRDGEALIGAAAAAGYDLGGYRSALDNLSKR